MDDGERIKAYWNDRALLDKSAQSTTLDFYLREIEFRCVKTAISMSNPTRVLDIGCGDAYTTLRLADAFPHTAFVGGDYAAAMVENAKNNVRQSRVKNVEIIEFDVTKSKELSSFDFIYTTRCLINLSGWESQKSAISNTALLVKSGGTYVMIENFADGHRDMNAVRKLFGLPEIEIRHHNHFFEQDALLPFLTEMFEIEGVQNISSAYYLTTRIVYAKICQEKNVQPDYFDEHHRLGSQLPFSGNFGPVKMITLKRR